MRTSSGGLGCVALLALALSAAGCGETALLLEVRAGSARTQVASLDLALYEATDDPRELRRTELTEGTAVNLEGRDLASDPYTLLVRKAGSTPSRTPFTLIGVAATTDGRLLTGKLDEIEWVDGKTVRYRLLLAAPDGSAPRLELAVNGDSTRFCEVGTRFMQLCTDDDGAGCDCDNVDRPGCGYLPGGACDDYDGDGCLDEDDNDPVSPSSACGICPDDPRCSLRGSCNTTSICAPQSQNVMACSFNSTLPGCGAPACDASPLPLVDAIPCFQRQGGSCRPGVRRCLGGSFTCTTDATLEADPFLCDLYSECVLRAQQDPANPSPGACTIKEVKFEPPQQINNVVVTFGALFLEQACATNSCLLELKDLRSLLDQIDPVHDINADQALCCYDVSNAELQPGSTGQACKGQAPTQPCQQLDRILVKLGSGPFDLALTVVDGGDAHRFVFHFDAPLTCDSSLPAVPCAPTPAQLP